MSHKQSVSYVFQATALLRLQERLDVSFDQALAIVDMCSTCQCNVVNEEIVRRAISSFENQFPVKE